MPSFKSGNAMFDGASHGFSRLAAALMTKDQAYKQGYDNESLNQSRMAQAMSQIGLHDAQAEEARRKADLLAREAELGKPAAVLDRAMLATGVPLDARDDVQQYLNAGRIDRYDTGGMPGPVMPAPDWATKGNLGVVAKRVAGSDAVLGGEAKDAQDYFKGQGVLRNMGLSDQIIAGAVDRNKVGGAEAAVAGKPLYNSDASGAVLDLFGGGLDTNNPMAKSSIALKGAQAGAQNASAASSYASADNSRASAAKTRQEVSEGGSPAVQIVTNQDGAVMLVNKRTGQARPAVGPDGSPVSAKGSQQRVQDANDVLDLLKMAQPIVAKATSSYLGRGLDKSAQLFGMSTDGADAAAQLQAIEGMLVSKMPKMSGPQSDKDVLLYKQMAGRIGDPTVPVSQKQAAMVAIANINRRYAGQQPSMTLPPANSGPSPGAVVDGYRFKGGNPADQASWEQVQ